MGARLLLDPRVKCLDAGIVVVSDATGEDLAQHICIEVQGDIDLPCMHSCS